MARARIRYTEGSNCVILTYHLPGGWLAPLVGFWCVAGGLAVGIGVAVALTVAGLTDTITFRQVLIAVTVIVAGMLYAAGYLWALRTRFLRLTFDYAGDRIEIYPAYANRRPAQYAFGDVFAFRLIDRSTAWRAGCALLMEKYGDEPETLLALNRHCDDERTALPHFVARLEAQLEVNPVADTDPHPLPLSVALPVPVRRAHGDPYDVYNAQQPPE
jgi:hypothetical protein